MRTIREIFIEVITHLTEPQITHKHITITPTKGGVVFHQEAIYFALFDNYNKRIAHIAFRGNHWAIGRCNHEYLRLQCHHIRLGEMEYFVNPITKEQFEDQDKIALIVEVPVL